MCSTFLPLSRTRVLRPCSQSSFAAQPPLIPEPITIASNVFTSQKFYLHIMVTRKLRNCLRLWHQVLFRHTQEPQIVFHSPHTCLAWQNSLKEVSFSTTAY